MVQPVPAPAIGRPLRNFRAIPMMLLRESTGLMNEDDWDTYQEIADRGPDLSTRIAEAKAEFMQFMADSEEQRAGAVRRKAEINNDELTDRVDCKTAVTLRKEIEATIARLSLELKERLKRRSAEVAQFDKENAAIRWAEKQSKGRRG